MLREVSTDICTFCHKTVSPRELAVEARKRQYHARGFTCPTCHCQLAEQSFTGRMCVPSANPATRTCWRSAARVVRWSRSTLLGPGLPPLTRVSCVRCIGAESFALGRQNEVHCLDDFHKKFAPIGSICENPIVRPSFVRLGKMPSKLTALEETPMKIATGVRTAGPFCLWSPPTKAATAEQPSLLQAVPCEAECCGVLQRVPAGHQAVSPTWRGVLPDLVSLPDLLLHTGDQPASRPSLSRTQQG
ncbi:hypothetical protein P7K49_021868 [Saguinus oedipus]|uniref:LIM zinc-binding domain-containing protein n=1 Tax=Saguinus oedipus TaxID=9490 RepID=A0ABQ9UTX0_SAGOE|nr:hypothetical protein P7K49_021868 [Saguinus oedipus]